MFIYLTSLLLQSSVIGDLRAERGGESMWSTSFGVVVGIVFIYLLLKGMYNSKD